MTWAGGAARRRRVVQGAHGHGGSDSDEEQDRQDHGRLEDRAPLWLFFTVFPWSWLYGERTGDSAGLVHFPGLGWCHRPRSQRRPRTAAPPVPLRRSRRPFAAASGELWRLGLRRPAPTRRRPSVRGLCPRGAGPRRVPATGPSGANRRSCFEVSFGLGVQVGLPHDDGVGLDHHGVGLALQLRRRLRRQLRVRLGHRTSLVGSGRRVRAHCPTSALRQRSMLRHRPRASRTPTCRRTTWRTPTRPAPPRCRAAARTSSTAPRAVIASASCWLSACVEPFAKVGGSSSTERRTVSTIRSYAAPARALRPLPRSVRRRRAARRPSRSQSRRGSARPRPRAPRLPSAMSASSGSGKKTSQSNSSSPSSKSPVRSVVMASSSRHRPRCGRARAPRRVNGRVRTVGAPRPARQRAPRPPGRAMGPQAPIGQIDTRVESFCSSGGGGI